MKKLRELRRSTGLTQHELARLTGMSVGRIAFAETKRLTLTASEIEKIRLTLAQRAQEVAATLAAA
jgi:transcriptional regulator with XRE-family HTH domain